MRLILYLFLVAAGIITAGAVMIYAIESPNEDSQIQTWLDAFWWSVATATTVGYGDIVPVTEMGRTLALVYMFFGIGLIATFFSVLGSSVYKKRFQKTEDLSHGHKTILQKIEELEKQQKEQTKILNDVKKKLAENDKDLVQ